MFTFQQFGAYKKAKALNIQLDTILRNRSVPQYTRDQLHRAAVSVILNIAEGSGRDTLPDRNRFFSMAKGSAMECVAIIDILRDSQLIKEEQYLKMAGLAKEIIQILYTTLKGK